MNNIRLALINSDWRAAVRPRH
ncbi:hypothetical protein THIX_90598 [Thiomonas sp. X19]|nr:hypothetical protein THIX_90598 [Thiomonas sp. X19]